MDNGKKTITKVEQRKCAFEKFKVTMWRGAISLNYTIYLKSQWLWKGTVLTMGITAQTSTNVAKINGIK